MAICALCQQDREPRESHVIPKFVFQWMKETGGKYFRSVSSPNVRRQDGEKLALLCQDCEQLFSAQEKWFAETIFKPYLAASNSVARFEYGPQLYYFAVSILWRTLVVNLIRGTFPANFEVNLREAEAEWRSYLLGGKAPSRRKAMHLFLAGIGLGGQQAPTPNFNRYVARNVDGTIGASQTDCFVYAKFSRFLFFGEVTPLHLKPEDGTEIDPMGGTIGAPQNLSDGHLGDFLVSRAQGIHDVMKKELSRPQRDKINAFVRESRATFLQSDLGKVLAADFDSQTSPLEEDVGRNDPCPCGSGKKFKKCHG